MTDNRDEQKAKPTWPDIVGYLLAAAILIPVGVWLKQNATIDEWLRALFY